MATFHSQIREPADDQGWRRTPQQPSALPEWMRNPPPPRRTLADRVATAAAALPGAQSIRRRWWAWQERRRLYQRFPNAFKVVAFFLSWIVALALVLTFYGLYQLA